MSTEAAGEAEAPSGLLNASTLAAFIRSTEAERSARWKRVWETLRAAGRSLARAAALGAVALLLLHLPAGLPVRFSQGHPDTTGTVVLYYNGVDVVRPVLGDLPAVVGGSSSRDASVGDAPQGSSNSGAPPGVTEPGHKPAVATHIDVSPTSATHLEAWRTVHEELGDWQVQLEATEEGLHVTAKAADGRSWTRRVRARGPRALSNVRPVKNGAGLALLAWGAARADPQLAVVYLSVPDDVFALSTPFKLALLPLESEVGGRARGGGGPSPGALAQGAPPEGATPPTAAVGQVVTPTKAPTLTTPNLHLYVSSFLCFAVGALPAGSLFIKAFDLRGRVRWAAEWQLAPRAWLTLGPLHSALHTPTNYYYIFNNTGRVTLGR